MEHGDQIQIAKAVNCDPGHLSKILKGKARPSWDLAKRLAAETGTIPTDWMEGPENIEKALSAGSSNFMIHNSLKN